jgi:alpha/beta superfamily hydrolase
VGETELRRERRALCLVSFGGFAFGGVLVDVVVMLVAAERAVIEEAGEVGPDAFAAAADDIVVEG